MSLPPTPGAQSPAATGIWGVFAGLVGGLCCLGPSAALLLGLGSSSALFGLQFARSYSLAAGLLLFGLGAFRSWRHGGSCGLSLGRRALAPALMLATFALSYLLLGIVTPALAARQLDDTALPVRAAPIQTGQPLRQLVVSIDKMDCPPCVAQVRRLLATEPSVRSFVAQGGLDEVQITYDPVHGDIAGLLDLFPSSYRATLIADTPLPPSQ